RILDASKNRRLDELTSAEARPSETPAAMQAYRSFRFRDLDVLHDFLKLRPGGDRPDLSFWIGRIANLRCARYCEDFVQELVVDGILQEKPRPGHAGLPASRKYPSYDAVCGLIEIRVVENDVRGFSPELEAHPFQPLGRRRINFAATGIASGEG